MKNNNIFSITYFLLFMFIIIISCHNRTKKGQNHNNKDLEHDCNCTKQMRKIIKQNKLLKKEILKYLNINKEKTNMFSKKMDIFSIKTYEQCGGKDWKPPFHCEHGSKCQYKDEFYSQCLPTTKVDNKRDHDGDV